MRLRCMGAAVMVANDISERKSYEDTRKELGEKMLREEEENQP